MTLDELNAKIEWFLLDIEEARVVRDTRFGILGVHAGQEPTEAQVAIVRDELFPAP